MFRLTAPLLVALMLGACGTLPSGPRVVATLTPEPSGELECMAECLGESGETCESCADRCFEREGANVALVAPTRR